MAEQRVESVEVGSNEYVLVDGVTGNGSQLRVVDVATNADSDEVDVLVPGRDRLGPCVTRVVRATVGDDDAHVWNVALIAYGRNSEFAVHQPN